MHEITIIEMDDGADGNLTHIGKGLPTSPEIRLFCPLEVKTDPDSALGVEYGVGESEFGYATISNDVAADYAEIIQAAIVQDTAPSDEERERGLAVYFDGDEIYAAKVHSVIPSVEVWKNDLWGVVTIKTAEDLTSNEMAELHDRCVGDLSDGWGEHFEQHPVRTPQGDLYVSFWHSGGDYYLKPEQEVKGLQQNLAEPEPEQGPTMGGMYR